MPKAFNILVVLQMSITFYYFYRLAQFISIVTDLW
jgi:hypothetical protein